MERSAILTVQNHVITRNPRISVSHDQHHTWNLHISSIQESDRGGYMSVFILKRYHFSLLFLFLKTFQLISLVYMCLGAKSTQRLPRPASATSRSSVSALHSFFLHHLPYNQRAIANHSYRDPGIPLAIMSIKKGRPSSHLFFPSVLQTREGVRR